VLDRIVGYFLSPLLWRKIGRGLSAGRVQSVALKLIVDRERAIAGFVPQEYWDIEADFHKKEKKGGAFTARLDKINGVKATIAAQADADAYCRDIQTKEYRVSEVKESEKKRNADAPFTTSTLQQEAFNKLRYNASRTMLIAQQLYEGIDVGQDTPVGLITYMRTDSTKVAPEAVEEVRRHIGQRFGPEYLPEVPNVFKVKKLAQEAHEAIRPSLINRDPASLQQFLTPEQYKLYELIYNRFLASQMTPARYKTTSVQISGGQYQFIAAGSELVFSGCLAAYGKSEDDAEAKEEAKRHKKIPVLAEGEALNLVKVGPEQHFTKPPARYSDSSLVKALEEEGIGRPSTYAPIIGTLLARDYVRRIKGYFHASELGCKVCDMLVEYFPVIMDVKFTADLEDKLDDIEEGKFDKVKILEEFYHPFKESLDHAQNTIKKEVVMTDQVCDLCGKQMVVKWGRRGKFLSCSAFPECKFSKSITTDVSCPQEGCGGKLIERRSRRGIFYGCSNFPKCTFTSRNLPDTEQKPESAGQEPANPQTG
jgi:DNA topoisomerase-1